MHFWNTASSEFKKLSIVKSSSHDLGMTLCSSSSSSNKNLNEQLNNLLKQKNINLLKNIEIVDPSDPRLKNDKAH